MAWGYPSCNRLIESERDITTDPIAGAAEAEPHRANKEARYRVERNDARAALDAAKARIESLLRSDIERVSAEVLAQGSDVFLSADDVSVFLNADGGVDYDLVLESAKQLLVDRPGLRKSQPAYDPSQGLGGTPNVKPEPSWGFLLQGQ